MRRFSEIRGRVIQLGFNPEGTRLTAVVRGAMKLGMWELTDGRFQRWHPYIDDAVSCFAYSPDGKWFVIGGEIGMALPYIRAKDNYDSEIHAAQPISALAFSSRVVAGRTVLAVGADQVRLYDLDAPYGDMNALWDTQLLSPKGWFRSLAFHPSESVLIGCDTNYDALRVWNPVSRGELHAPVLRGSAPTAVVFSTDGYRLLVACGAHVKLLDTLTWKVVSVCRHSRGRVTGVTASPCGRWFATAGTDHTVRFWNSVSGDEERVFDWKIGSITALAFAPDGLTCAAGGENGQVVIWDVDM